VAAGEPKTSFRLRSAYLGHLVVGSGDGAMLIEPTVAGELRMAAALAGKRPMAGLLYGHTWHDDEGGYTLVEGYVPAASAETVPVDADPAAVRARLREEAARSYPGAAEVGWWRTAPRPGEEGWPDPGAWPLGERPEGVGLVVFADGTPPTTAVLVPHAVVQGSVIEDWRNPDPPRPEHDRPEHERPEHERRLVVEAEPMHSAPDERPTRGANRPRIQSPDPDQMWRPGSTQRHEHVEHESLEPAKIVAMVAFLLVVVVIVGVVVLVSPLF
jgi:hypothetical protein